LAAADPFSPQPSGPAFAGRHHHYLRNGALDLSNHGIAKPLPVIRVPRNKLWSYPASLIILGLFIVYQLYRFSYRHGAGLILLTVFDIFVMGLIWHEYRLMRHQQPTK